MGARMRTTVMIGALAALVVAGVGEADAQTRIDRVVPVGERTRLDLHNHHGDVTIRTWDRLEVRVVAAHDGPSNVEIDAGGAELSIHTQRPDPGRPVQYDLTVPASMDLAVHAVDSDVTVDGTRGRVEIHSVKGDVVVRGGRTVVHLGSVQGSVRLSDASGSIEVSSVNQGIDLERVSGDVQASTVNGGIRLAGVDARRVEASTVNGGIEYAGPLHADGWYSLSTHNGGIDLALPASPNARIEVSTFNGDFQADFPVRLDRAEGGREFDFTLGSGEARVELESFNGTIRLRRGSR